MVRQSSRGCVLVFGCYPRRPIFFSVFFFFNDTATTEIYTLSLHDALPIYHGGGHGNAVLGTQGQHALEGVDRKSTRLNSSHLVISYAVFCLKKKKDSLHSLCLTRSYKSARLRRIVCRSLPVRSRLCLRPAR